MRKALSKAQINEIFQENNLVNYFSFASAFEEMEKTGHICPVPTEGDAVYELTELGSQTSDSLETVLPASVREKCVQTALRLIAKYNRQACTKAAITTTDAGYIVRCRVLDIGSDLLDLSLFVPDKPQAEAVKKLFLEEPEAVYRGCVSLLTGDFKNFDGFFKGK